MSIQLTSEFPEATRLVNYFWSTFEPVASERLREQFEGTFALMSPTQRLATQVEVLWANRVELPDSGLEVIANGANCCKSEFLFGFHVDRRGALMIGACLRALGEPDADQAEELDPTADPRFAEVDPGPPPPGMP